MSVIGSLAGDGGRPGTWVMSSMVTSAISTKSRSRIFLTILEVVSRGSGVAAQPVFVATAAASRSSLPAEVWPGSNNGYERKASDDASVTASVPMPVGRGGPSDQGMSRGPASAPRVAQIRAAVCVRPCGGTRSAVRGRDCSLSASLRVVGPFPPGPLCLVALARGRDADTHLRKGGPRE